jgi:hypothetical protein
MSTKIYITCPEAEIAVWTGFRAPPGTGLAALKEVTPIAGTPLPPIGNRICRRSRCPSGDLSEIDY